VSNTYCPVSYVKAIKIEFSFVTNLSHNPRNQVNENVNYKLRTASTSNEINAIWVKHNTFRSFCCKHLRKNDKTTIVDRKLSL